MKVVLVCIETCRYKVLRNEPRGMYYGSKLQEALETAH